MKISSCNFCGCITNRPVIVDVFRSLGCPECGVPYDLPIKKRKKTKKSGYKRGKIRRVTRDSIMVRDNHECLKCGSDEDLTMDHINPVCKGGNSRKENLQTLCYLCNQEKGDCVIDYRK